MKAASETCEIARRDWLKTAGLGGAGVVQHNLL
jgi:hypothetical protein